jgi:peroxin-1
MRKITETQSAAPNVIIRQVNIDSSLASTRPSISDMERNRLAGIYYKFQHGRSGELPNGMAPDAISSRTSLM